jgi:hypothetical protein
MRTLSKSAQVASIIRKTLKGYQIPASVKSDGYDCVRIQLEEWYDNETINAIKKKFYQYDEDPSDVSNTDLFVSQNMRTDVPQVRYLFIENGNRTEQDEILAKEYLKDMFCVIDDKTSREVFQCWLWMAINDCFRGARFKNFEQWTFDNGKRYLLTLKSHFIISETK